MRIRISRSILWIIHPARMGGREMEDMCILVEEIVQMGSISGGRVFSGSAVRNFRDGPENCRGLQRVVSI